MADHHYSLRILGVMDRLWFHQIILFSSDSSSTLLLPETFKLKSPLVTDSLLHLPSTLSLPSLHDQEIPPPLSAQDQPTYPQLQNKKEEVDNKVVNQKERRTRFNLCTNRVRSHSSSPSSVERGQQPKYIRRSSSLRKLEKSMSFRSLGELELEEVKGFMDLGFIFKKENINPRMMSVVPGLLRLGLYNNKQPIKLIDNQEVPQIDDNDDDIVKDEEEENRGIIRPYLSEAWLIRRPDSALSNLKLPRVSAASDMKKHLKFWAKTVASVIQQES